jgi:hypothetical protein
MFVPIPITFTFRSRHWIVAREAAPGDCILRMSREYVIDTLVPTTWEGQPEMSGKTRMKK